MSMLSEALSFLCPTACCVCGALVAHGPFGHLCGRCHRALPRTTHPVRAPRGVVSCWSLGAYEGPLGALVRLAKYGPSIAAIDLLGAQLAGCMAVMPSVDGVVGVPTLRGRRWRRGFCQGERLARAVGMTQGIPLLEGMVRCHGRPQVGRSASERERLADDVFHLPQLDPGRRILLVDDVHTTGATLSAAARALRRQGASQVWAVTVCFQDVKSA